MQPTSIRLSIPDSIDPTRLMGPADANLRRVEAAFEALVSVRGNQVLVSGSAFFGHPPYDQCHQKFQAAAQAAADNAHNARCAAAALWQPGRALKK